MPPDVIVDEFVYGNSSGGQVSRILSGVDISQFDVFVRGDLFQPVLNEYG